MDAVISFQEAKKAQRAVGKLNELNTNFKDHTVGAINELEFALSLLLPSPPPNLSTKTLTMNGTNCLLAKDAPNNSGSVITTGMTVRATRSLKPESNTITSFGSGNVGVLSVELNGQERGSKQLGAGSDQGTYQDLVISKDSPFPIETPGFWEALDARYKPSLDLQYGYNEVEMKHSTSGNTNIAGIVIDTEGNPNVSEIEIEEDFLSPSYSSGIVHYGAGSKFRISAKVKNTISYVYENTLIEVLGSGLSTKSYSIASLGGEPVIGREIDFLDIVTLTQNYVGLGSYSVRGRHPLATNHIETTNKNILVKIGTGGVNEGLRVNTLNEEYPFENPIVPSFNSALPLLPHEAKIVGGELKHDKTDYRTYMPVGLDYSNHNQYQYACFVFDLNSSTNANIILTGTGLYEKCWVKLPNVTGWLDTGLPYDGASTDFSDGRPCKVSGTKSNFIVTFGTNSSASSSNKILLRFKMSQDQIIRSIVVNRGA
jgi:hypothetical protein